MDEKEVNQKLTAVNLFKEYFKENKNLNDKIVDKLDQHPYDGPLFLDYHKLPRGIIDIGVVNKIDGMLQAGQKAIKNIDPKERDIALNIIITNLPANISINQIKSVDVGSLVTFEGLITEANEIKPLLSNAVFECRSCMRLHEIPQRSTRISEPAICQECGGRSFRLLQDESSFIDSQTFKITGIKPDETRELKAVLKGSLIEYNKFRKGMKVKVTAIPSINRQNGSMELFLSIHNIEPLESGEPSFEFNSDEPIPTSNIYFISDGDCVKIGKADDPQKRLSGIQTGNSKPLKLLYTMKGDERLEGFLHELFADYRKVGEWFRLDGLLEDFLKRGYIIGTHKTVDHYVDFFNDDGRDVEEGDSIKNDYPILSLMLTRLAKELEDITHVMDWDYSCDSSIKDKVGFEIESVHKILNAVDIQDIIKNKE